MKHTLLASAVLASILLLPACKREAEPASAPAVAAPADSVPADSAAKDAGTMEASSPDVEILSETAHTPVSATAAAAAATFDAKQYAGSFAGPAGRLTLTSDGAFTFEQDGSPLTGTWTLQDDGKHLLLDPDSKSAQDLRYEMVGNDALQGSGGKPQRLLREKR